MNILVLSHRIPFPANKGEKIRTFYQLEYLANKGHKLDVLAPLDSAEDHNYAAELTNLFCNSARCFDKPALLSAAAKAVLTHQAVSVASFYSSDLQQAFDDALQTQTIDLVLCTSSSMAEYIFRSKPLAQDSKRRPLLIMDFMDLDSDKWRQYAQMKHFPVNLIYKRESLLLAEYEKKIHAHFDASLFISQNEIDLFLKTTPDLNRLHEIGNGIDTSSFSPSSSPKPEKGPIFLFTGVMDYLPNEDAVCWFVDEAWSLVKQKHPDAEFYIAGMSPSTKVQALSAQPDVHVTGFVDDITEYFDRAHIFIAPFRLARGVQNKVLQAFACGLPTITTSSGCEGIEAIDNKHVLIAEDMEQVVEAIDALIESQELRETLSRESAQLIEAQFSWGSKLAKLEQIIQNHQPIKPTE